MLFRGSRNTVPSSRYGWQIGIMEAMHWTYAELMAQPYLLIEELRIRLEKRTHVERERARNG